jgi:23S rRNA (cytosine1962-C5)-methyltransferase
MKLELKKDRDFAVFSGHPWVYREAVKAFPEKILPGSPVEVFSHRGQFLGLALADPESTIVLRVLSGSRPGEEIREVIKRNISQAAAIRRAGFDPARTNACRVINGEGDGLSALIVDQFADALSLQTYSPAWEPYIDLVVETLHGLFPEVKWIYRRNQVRRAETTREGCIFGRNFPGKIRFRENDRLFEADLAHGQKTGFFLDQRDNRHLVGSLASGRRVANVCGYTGAFSVYALTGGAEEVVTVDSAAPALEQAKINLALNGFSSRDNPLVRADMLEFLKQETPGRFDLIVLDPPSMAKARKDVPRALNTYRALNQAAAKALKPGGLLFTASCSSQVGREDFLRVIQEASRKAETKMKLLAETHHGLDHPIALGHPEGRYLHALLLEVI